jgi:uncharacterized protein YegP (UPF0339 family)
MSEKLIRTSSNAVSDAGRTDWARVRDMGDEAIDAAIAGDADSYELDTEILGRADSAYHYEVYRESAGKYRWRLLSADSQVLASSPEGFRTKAAALNAIAGVRQALLGGSALAA